MAYSPKNPNGQATMANSEPVVIASDQSAVPVSGTVTANLSATDNAVLDDIAADTEAIKTAVEILDNAIAGTEMQVDVVTSALPSGAATAANQSTIIGHVDGIEGILTTIDADTGGILTAVQLIDNAISGNEMQVDVVTMPAITGTVTANLSATDNAVLDQIELNQDTQTAVLNTIDADTGSILTAVQLIDDTVLTDDAGVTLGTTKGNTVAGVAVAMDGTDPLAVSAEGDAALLRSDPNRILLVNQTHPRFFRASADYASAQTNASVQAAPGASLSLYITDVIISNGATAGNITLLDGSGGSVVLELYPAINGGLTHSFRNPIKLTANTALCITSTTVTTHTITVTGYIAA